MTAREYCNNNPAIAYASRNAGLEIHGIEYGVNDYVYAVSGAWIGEKGKSRLHSSRAGVLPYLRKPCIFR